MTTPPPGPAWTDLPPHDAWFEAFGRAFVVDDLADATHRGECSACGQKRKDLLKKGRMICPRCQAMNSKKPKREGGKAGPSPNQLVLIQPRQAMYAGPIGAPPWLPTGARMDERHGEAALLALLYDPPEPPFYVAHLAMNSDPVLGQTRLTRDLRRLHVGSLVPVTLNQPLLRRALDAVMTHPEPRKTLVQLGRLQSPLVRGPGSDQDRWADAMDAIEALTETAPALSRLFPDHGRWAVCPGDHHWPWLEKLVSAKVREIL